MQYECKITVLDTKVFPELQEKYLANPKSGKCPFFNVGDTFVLKRTAEQDDFYHLMNGKFCGEAWDAISRYVYSALQGGSIMRNWTNDDRMMIACCNDGTRPVIFKQNLSLQEQYAKSVRTEVSDSVYNIYHQVKAQEKEAINDLMQYVQANSDQMEKDITACASKVRSATEAADKASLQISKSVKRFCTVRTFKRNIGMPCASGAKPAQSIV